MTDFGRFYLDKEKDIIVELSGGGDALAYTLRTPNHATGNLITNLARLCRLPISMDESGLKVIRGEIPCYVDDSNREVYVFRLGDTKVANIYPDGAIERKAYIPAIAKTLMSQTKDYRLDIRKTLVKTYILRDVKFRTDLHTHMNANLDPDILIALGIRHQIRYPLYYIRKLGLRMTAAQRDELEIRRAAEAERWADSGLKGKYLDRKIDDNTFINFADFILNNAENAAYNLPRIRASLTILKDGQAVFTNLEKVYLYRYVFTKGQPYGERIPLERLGRIPDADIVRALEQMAADQQNPDFAANTLFEDKLLWIGRSAAAKGVRYMEISDTTLVKPDQAPLMLAQAHRVLPAVERETGVIIRFLAGIRRIPLTIVRDQIAAQGTLRDSLRAVRAVACDPYVAGSDILGEEINDIRELRPVIHALVKVAGENDGFTLRIHAGENDSLRDNVANSLRCVREALAPGQAMPPVRIGHGLYTANLASKKGRQLIQDLRESGAVLEFQITSNVRLNNLSALEHHPLKQYLRGGIACVQGTDGGAIYGTDSIDEQLSLERLLELSHAELLAMRRAEDEVLARSEASFRRKLAAFPALTGGEDVGAFYRARMAAEWEEEEELTRGEKRLESAAVLAERVSEIPAGRVPVVVLGGSFNSDRHTTRARPSFLRLIERLTETLDPEKVCFVIGHRVTGYEACLAERAAGRFPLWAIVPTRLREGEAARLRKSGAGIRVSIEPSGMGVYKSFAYEIFKRRPSVLIALDGNSAGANTVQEAKNGKRKCRIFVSRHSRLLASKARTLEGYVRLIGGEEDAPAIAEAVNAVWEEMQTGS